MMKWTIAAILMVAGMSCEEWSKPLDKKSDNDWTPVQGECPTCLKKDLEGQYSESNIGKVLAPPPATASKLQQAQFQQPQKQPRLLSTRQSGQFHNQFQDLRFQNRQQQQQQQVGYGPAQPVPLTRNQQFGAFPQPQQQQTFPKPDGPKQFHKIRFPEDPKAVSNNRIPESEDLQLLYVPIDAHRGRKTLPNFKLQQQQQQPQPQFLQFPKFENQFPEFLFPNFPGQFDQQPNLNFSQPPNFPQQFFGFPFPQIPPQQFQFQQKPALLQPQPQNPALLQPQHQNPALSQTQPQNPVLLQPQPQLQSQPQPQQPLEGKLKPQPQEHRFKNSQELFPGRTERPIFQARPETNPQLNVPEANQFQQPPPLFNLPQFAVDPFGIPLNFQQPPPIGNPQGFPLGDQRKPNLPQVTKQVLYEFNDNFNGNNLRNDQTKFTEPHRFKTDLTTEKYAADSSKSSEAQTTPMTTQFTQNGVTFLTREQPATQFPTNFQQTTPSSVFSQQNPLIMNLQFDEQFLQQSPRQPFMSQVAPPQFLPPPLRRPTTQPPLPSSEDYPAPHQPPLSVYTENNRNSKFTDVLNLLKAAKTVPVIDTIEGETAPAVFVGPSELEPPKGYVKYELPYLSNLDYTRIEQMIDRLPFFVAPLNFKPPPGYSKIPFPAPHIGSVVVSNSSGGNQLSQKAPFEYSTTVLTSFSLAPEVTIPSTIPPSVTLFTPKRAQKSRPTTTPQPVPTEEVTKKTTSYRHRRPIHRGFPTTTTTAASFETPAQYFETKYQDSHTDSTKDISYSKSTTKTAYSIYDNYPTGQGNNVELSTTTTSPELPHRFNPSDFIFKPEGANIPGLRGKIPSSSPPTPTNADRGNKYGLFEPEYEDNNQPPRFQPEQEAGKQQEQTHPYVEEIRNQFQQSVPPQSQEPPTQFQETVQTENQFQQTTPKENGFRKPIPDQNRYQPQAPEENVFQQPSPNQNEFQQSVSPQSQEPSTQFQETVQTENQFHQTNPKENRFRKPIPDQNRFQQPSSDQNRFQQASVEQNRFQQQSPEENGFQKSNSDQNRFQQQIPEENGFQKPIPDENRFQQSPEENGFQKPILNQNGFQQPSEGNQFQKATPEGNQYEQSVPDQNQNSFQRQPPTRNEFQPEVTPDVGQGQFAQTEVPKEIQFEPDINTYQNPESNKNRLKTEEQPPPLQYHKEVTQNYPQTQVDPRSKEPDQNNVQDVPIENKPANNFVDVKPLSHFKPPTPTATERIEYEATQPPPPPFTKKFKNRLTTTTTTTEEIPLTPSTDFARTSTEFVEVTPSTEANQPETVELHRTEGTPHFKRTKYRNRYTTTTEAEAEGTREESPATSTEIPKRRRRPTRPTTSIDSNTRGFRRRPDQRYRVRRPTSTTESADEVVTIPPSAPAANEVIPESSSAAPPPSPSTTTELPPTPESPPEETNLIQERRFVTTGRESTEANREVVPSREEFNAVNRDEDFGSRTQAGKDGSNEYAPQKPQGFENEQRIPGRRKGAWVRRIRVKRPQYHQERPQDLFETAESQSLGSVSENSIRIRGKDTTSKTSYQAEKETEYEASPTTQSYAKEVSGISSTEAEINTTPKKEATTTTTTTTELPTSEETFHQEDSKETSQELMESHETPYESELPSSQHGSITVEGTFKHPETSSEKQQQSNEEAEQPSDDIQQQEQQELDQDAYDYPTEPPKTLTSSETPSTERHPGFTEFKTDEESTPEADPVENVRDDFTQMLTDLFLTNEKMKQNSTTTTTTTTTEGDKTITTGGLPSNHKPDTYVEDEAEITTEVASVGTSTTTEISLETEICYRGKCVKTKKRKATDLLPVE